ALAHPVWIAPDHIDPAPAFDPSRQQYLVSALMETLLGRSSEEGVFTIGVTDVDLFLPVFTHVFGTAQLGGPVGVASEFRLRPELSGDPSDAGLLRRRLLVEVLHELGHTLGLVHCKASWCAMSPSRLPEQIDLKDATFCTACAEHTGVPNHSLVSIKSWEGEKE
ncbi:MAG: archaemetzincin, partial [Acidobacteriota bacterium]